MSKLSYDHAKLICRSKSHIIGLMKQINFSYQGGSQGQSSITYYIRKLNLGKVWTFQVKLRVLHKAVQ